MHSICRYIVLSFFHKVVKFGMQIHFPIIFTFCAKFDQFTNLSRHLSLLLCPVWPWPSPCLTPILMPCPMTCLPTTQSLIMEPLDALRFRLTVDPLRIREDTRALPPGDFMSLNPRTPSTDMDTTNQTATPLLRHILPRLLIL